MTKLVNPNIETKNCTKRTFRPLEYGIYLIAFLIFVIFSVSTKAFLSANNMIQLLSNCATMFVVCAGMNFALAHELGMDVFFHTCGSVYPIIGDLIDAGVDMLNLGQLNLNDPERLQKEFKGKVCFCQPLDYQKTGLSGTREEILAEGKYIFDLLASKNGGLIAEIFDYELMGWQPKDPRNTHYQIEAFDYC